MFSFSNNNPERSNNEITSKETDEAVSFIPPGKIPVNPSPVNPNLGMSIDEAANVIGENSERISDISNDLLNGNVAGAVSKLKITDAKWLWSQFKGYRSGIKVKVDGRDPDGPASYEYKPTGGGGSSAVNYSRLSAEPEPTEISFSTGIKPNCYVPEVNTYESNYNFPIHVNICTFSFPTASSASDAGTFFQNSVMYDLKNAISKNLTFSPPSALVTYSNLENAIDALCYALQVYYSITALLVYGNTPMNKHDGLLWLRDQIPGSITDSYYQLRRMLMSTPIPRNLNDTIFWLSQVYLSGETPSASVILTVPYGFPNGVPTFTNEINSAVSGLLSYTDTYSLIGRAIPQWYATELKTGSPNFKYDGEYCTAWVNMPYWVTSTGTYVYNNLGPTITSSSSRIYYNSYVENLDGGVFALTSAWDSTNSIYSPSLLVPVRTQVSANNLTNRLSWAGRSVGMIASDTNDSSAFGRDDTYTNSFRFLTAANISVTMGSQRVWGVNVATITNCCFQMMDWLMSWDTVTSRVDKNLQNTGLINYHKQSRAPKSNGNPSKSKKKQYKGSNKNKENKSK